MQNDPWAAFNPQGQASQPSAAPRPVTVGTPRPEKPRDPPSGYNWGPNGSLTPIPGGPADKPKGGDASDPKTTEAEKTAAFLATRVAGGLTDLQTALSDEPGAASPGVIPTVLGALPLVGDYAQRKANSPARQRVEAAQMDILDAALTLGTGAAYNKEQLVAYTQSYFPQLGDDEATIKDKHTRLVRLLEAARLKAGNAAPQIDQALAAVNAMAPGAAPQRGGDRKDDLLPGEFYDNGNKMYRDPETGEVLPVVDVTTNYDAKQQAIIDQYQTNAQGAGGLDAFGEGMVDTITFGLRDELGAAGEAFAGALRGQGSFGDLYDAHVTGLRGLQGNLQENNGGAYLGGQILGGFAVPFGSGARGVGGLAKAGAAQGGAYGFGSSEGGPLERLPGAAVGAAGGGAVGGTLGYAGNALMKFMPNSAVNQAQREAAPIIQAGERRQVPIRQYDVRPDLRQERGVAMTSERGGPIIRAADEADAGAMEAAVARDLGGDITPGDRFAVGDMTQNALDRTREVGRNKAKRAYDVAEKLAGSVKLVPNRAIAEIDNQIAELTAAGPNANKELIGYLNDVKADLSREGGLTISALRDQRTSLRGQISTRNLSKTDAERRMGMVLDAAAQDIDGGLNGTAQAAFRKADQQWAERSRFIKQVMGNLVGPEDNRLSPEATAARLEGWMKKDANRFRRVWAELDGDERKEIAAAVAGRLGRDSKDNFSISLFLNHTSGKGKQAALSSKSMRLIFGEEGMRAIEDLRAIANAKVAGASEINSSKTGNIVQRVGRGFRTLALSALGFAGGGPVGAIAAPVAQSIASKMGQERMARLLTNPDFTKWLRTAPETTRPEVINRHMARLNKVASRSPVLAADARALQTFLGEAFSTSARQAAAGENEDNSR